jgi:hypothetical protein
MRNSKENLPIPFFPQLLQNIKANREGVFYFDRVYRYTIFCYARSKGREGLTISDLLGKEVVFTYNTETKEDLPVHEQSSVHPLLCHCRILKCLRIPSLGRTANVSGSICEEVFNAIG